MTFLIQRSRVQAGFDQAVALHAEELTAHARQMDLVRQGKADPYPAPTAHPLVDSAVRRDPGGRFVPDYQLVDRLPVATGDDAALAQRIAEFRVESQAREAREIAALSTPGKFRLTQLAAFIAGEKPLEARTPEDESVIAVYSALRERVMALNLKYATVEAEIDDLTFGNVNQFQFPL